MQAQVSTASPPVYREEAPELQHFFSEPSLLPRFRRTFRLFSERGVMTCGGGVVSGDLRIQLRKGFLNRTRIMVSYVNHKVFVELEGSPLEGDIRSKDILDSLRNTGMLPTIPVSQDRH
jgi:hypothetical protein